MRGSFRGRHRGCGRQRSRVLPARDSAAFPRFNIKLIAQALTTCGCFSNKELLFRPRVGWYDVFMSRDTEAPLDAFEHLPVEEKRTFTQEVLRRSLPFDSGPLEDEEIGAASAALFGSLEEEDGHPAPR